MREMKSQKKSADIASLNKPIELFFRVFTEIGSTVGVAVVFLVLALITGLEILYVFVPVYLFQLLCVELIKFVFRRPRPTTHHSKNIFGLTATSGSFPSGHTSNIFTLAFLLTNFYQFNLVLTSVVFLVAGAVAYSRILLGRHYTIDIAAGAIAGLVFSIIGVQIILPMVLPTILAIAPAF